MYIHIYMYIYIYIYICVCIYLFPSLFLLTAARESFFARVAKRLNAQLKRKEKDNSN